ncbi:hypothetical protein Y032_0004g1707 [Ancylostoma ceylanicum]|uniref:Uncharacterized protein n=1 Tax=Ancylostoma ceylanicum TaxID=53326 RepID=A0A016VTM8_9BILA|nr:hypothetical protein Y032_0004g1707 [Ancylostoma ceylanicum]
MEPLKISHSLCWLGIYYIDGCHQKHAQCCAPTKIDDVFITGVLTNASNVTVKNFQGITQGRKTPARTSNKETFFSLNKEHIIYWFFTYNYKVL